MKRYISKSAVLALAVIAGCVTGPVAYVHKTGSTVAQRQAAFDECKIAAIQQVPAQNRTEYTPGVHTPGTTYCNTIGTTVSCNTVGGVDIPGSVDTVDDNAGLRNRTINRCLASKGYSVAVLPACSGKKDYEGDSQPPLSQIKCASPRIQE